MGFTKNAVTGLHRFFQYGSFSGSSQTACYLALLTGKPAYDGSITSTGANLEVSTDTGYARIEIGKYLTSPEYDATEDQFSSTTSQELNFPHVVSAVKGITHWAIFPSATSTSASAYGAFDTSTDLAINDVFTIEKGKLKIIYK